MSSPIRQCMLTAAVLACSAAGMLPAQQNDSVLTYAVSVTVDSGGGRPPTSATMRMHAARGMVRVDLDTHDSSPKQPGMDGAYLLLRTGSDTVTTVIPGKQSVVIALSPGAMMAHAQGIHLGMVSAPSFRLEDLGDGPLILGLPTRHYRTTMDYEMELVVDSQHCRKPYHIVTETWRAPSVRIPPAVESRLLDAVTSGPIAGDAMEEFRALRAREPAGVLMRSESTSPAGVTTRSETIELNRSPVDDVVFQVPLQYRVTDARRMMAVMDARTMIPTLAAAMRKMVCQP
jgi:hypothetical protein